MVQHLAVLQAGFCHIQDRAHTGCVLLYGHAESQAEAGQGGRRECSNLSLVMQSYWLVLCVYTSAARVEVELPANSG